MILNQGLDGSSLIVQGDGGANHIGVHFYDSGWSNVTTDGPVVAGEGCQARMGGSLMARQLPRQHPPGSVVITGNGGDDSVDVGRKRPGRSQGPCQRQRRLRHPQRGPRR